MRRLGRVLAVAAAVAACQTGGPDDGPKTGFVMQPEEIPGESAMLRLEDERIVDKSALKRYLGSRDAGVRQRAVLAASRIGDPSFVSDLQALLNDRSDFVKATVAHALGLLGASELTGELDRLLTEGSATVRVGALRGRSLLGGDTVPPAVASLLDPSGGSMLLGEAILAAVRFDDLSIVPQLHALLAHEDADVRWKATYGLYHLKTDAEGLVFALGDPDPRVRAYAALGLGALADTEHVPVLLERLADPETDVVCAVADALATIRDPSATDALTALLDDPIPRRRFAGVYALARSGFGAARLRSLLDDPNPYIRAAAVDGLRRANGTRREFRTAAKDEDWHVRAAAARALAARGDLATLWQQMQYDPDARVIPAVLRALGDADYDGLDTILAKHLEDKDPLVRATAARLIVGRNVGSPIERLVRAYELSKNDDLVVGKLAIIETLAMYPGGGTRLDPIKQAAGSQDWVLKTRAYALLQEEGAASGIQAPSLVGTLRTESYYRDLVARGDFVYHATFTTDKGEFTFQLYPKTAQLSVAFLEEVVNSQFYIDQPLTELRPTWDLGGGDSRGDGFGRYISWLRDEPGGNRFNGKTLSLRRRFGRDSGTSQFRVSFLPRPDLDDQETPIGELLSGGEVLDQLVPGDLIKEIKITSHEFRGKFVRQRVRIDSPVEATETTTTAATTAPAPAPPKAGEWVRPPAILYLAMVGAVMLLASMAPMLGRESPPALWLTVGACLLVLGGYTGLVMTGSYFDILTSETPGARKLQLPNPPFMSDEQAVQACVFVMCYVVLQLALLFFLTSTKSYGRWLFLFLSLIEIALLALQLSTKMMIMYIIANAAILLNVAKIWFLLMDKGIRDHFATED